jgi:hypothetical protein
MVGLGNVDNTSDANKPVSTATQTALDLKATLASPTFTGSPSLPTGTTTITQLAGDNSTKLATTEFVTTKLAAGAPDATTTATGKIQLTGDNADVEINGVSLKKTLDDINSRLNILQPNVKLEKEWQELKTLGDQYRALEKDLEEKSKMWQVLKTPLPEEN